MKTLNSTRSCESLQISRDVSNSGYFPRALRYFKKCLEQLESKESWVKISLCTGNIQTINLPLPVWSAPTTQGDVLTKDRADKKSKRCSSLTPQLPSNELVHHQVPETPRDTVAPVQEYRHKGRGRKWMLVFKSTLGCVRCTFCPGYSNISVSTIYRCGKCQCFAICDVSVGTK